MHQSLSKENIKYTGLEHRQTLRACTSIVICQLKLKMDNLKFEIWKKNWKFVCESLEILKKKWKSGEKLKPEKLPQGKAFHNV